MEPEKNEPAKPSLFGNQQTSLFGGSAALPVSNLFGSGAAPAQNLFGSALSQNKPLFGSQDKPQPN